MSNKRNTGVTERRKKSRSSGMVKQFVLKKEIYREDGFLQKNLKMFPYKFEKTVDIFFAHHLCLLNIY
jgi:hypothetical protein